MHYTIDENHQVHEEPNIIKWAQAFETSNRAVAKTMVNDDIQVSTVFLGIDHGWGRGEPVLFETMTFALRCPGIDNDCYRSNTWDQAVNAHHRAVQKARDYLNSIEPID